jgi:hypothetical protein
MQARTCLTHVHKKTKNLQFKNPILLLSYILILVILWSLLLANMY